MEIPVKQPGDRSIIYTVSIITARPLVETYSTHYSYNGAVNALVDLLVTCHSPVDLPKYQTTARYQECWNILQSKRGNRYLTMDSCKELYSTIGDICPLSVEEWATQYTAFRETLIQYIVNSTIVSYGYCTYTIQAIPLPMEMPPQ